MLHSHTAELVRPATNARFIDDYLLYLLGRASHLISAEFHQEVRRRGISVPVWRVLASLIGSPKGETVTGLAEVCLLQQPTMTKLLARMERMGLVRRTGDPRDRRLVRIELTALGAAKAEDLIAAAKEHEASVLARHPDTDGDQFKLLLRGMMLKHMKTGRRAAKRG